MDFSNSSSGSAATSDMLKIFNMTDEHTKIPYYITMYNPCPLPYDTLGILRGSVETMELEKVFIKKACFIFQIWKQCMLQENLNVRPTSFDDVWNMYYLQPYTSNAPFSIYYFMDDEWKLYVFSEHAKHIVFMSIVDTVSL